MYFECEPVSIHLIHTLQAVYRASKQVSLKCSDMAKGHVNIYRRPYETASVITDSLDHPELLLVLHILQESSSNSAGERSKQTIGPEASCLTWTGFNPLLCVESMKHLAVKRNIFSLVSVVQKHNIKENKNGI